MAPNTRSPRQALSWVPFEIVPDDNERGYSLVQLNPEKDPATGSTTFVLHGNSPAPTIDDGYRVAATVEVDQEGGATVTRLEFVPSPTILDEGVRRPRTAEERRLAPINSYVVSLVKFTEILHCIVEVERGYAESLAELPERQAEIQLRLDRLRQRRPKKDPAGAAKHAEEALAVMFAGRGYQARLREDWGIGIEGVKKRISRLRADGWLHREYGRPGETLVAWRAGIVADDREPSLDSKED